MEVEQIRDVIEKGGYLAMNAVGTNFIFKPTSVTDGGECFGLFIEHKCLVVDNKWTDGTDVWHEADQSEVDKILNRQ